MIDHVLGRPSSKSRRLQVLAVLSLWSFYLYRYMRYRQPIVHTAFETNVILEDTNMDRPGPSHFLNSSPSALQRGKYLP